MDLSQRDKSIDLSLFLDCSPHHNFYYKFISRHSNKSNTMKAQNISVIRVKLVSPYIIIRKLREFMIIKLKQT